MTGRHAYPYAGVARVVDELHKTPVGSQPDSEPTGSNPAAAPPRRSPEGVSLTPQPLRRQPGDTSTPDTPSADLMRPIGEGVGLHSLIRRPTPELFAPRPATAHINAVRR